MNTNGRYNQLQEGARLLYGLESNVRAEMAISEGVGPAIGNAFGFRYEDHAVKPRKPWRSLNSGEESLLYTNDKSVSRLDNFSVIEIPEVLKDLVVYLQLSELNNEEEIADVRKSKPREFIAFKKMADALAMEYLAHGQIVHKFGIIVNTPNRETVTVREHTYVTGLHIDSWDHYPLNELDKCTNRICINLGKEDRYLLLVNQRLDTLYTWIKEEAKFDTNRDFWKDQVVAHFFHKIKDYPVLKVKIKPMQAYIAPTEILIHDGCTDGNKYPDIDMTYRGNFKLYKN